MKTKRPKITNSRTHIIRNSVGLHRRGLTDQIAAHLAAADGVHRAMFRVGELGLHTLSRPLHLQDAAERLRGG